MRSLCFMMLFLVTSSLSVAQKQGICGRVTWEQGNQMPGPDQPERKPKGIVREILIFEATTMEQAVSKDGLFTEIKTKMVARTNSKSNGYFKISLPPGEYSVFVKESKGFFANQFDTQNRINVVTVTPKKYTEMQILVNYQAAY